METHFASAAVCAESRTDASPDASARKPDVLNEAGELWQSMRCLTSAHLQLASLEIRLTGESLVTMIAAGVMVAVLLVSAWLVLLAAAVFGMVGNGFSIISALLIGVVVNLFAALLLYGVARRRSNLLGFPATIRSLGGGNSAGTNAGALQS